MFVYGQLFGFQYVDGIAQDCTILAPSYKRSLHQQYDCVLPQCLRITVYLFANLDVCT